MKYSPKRSTREKEKTKTVYCCLRPVSQKNLVAFNTGTLLSSLRSRSWRIFISNRDLFIRIKNLTQDIAFLINQLF